MLTNLTNKMSIDRIIKRETFVIDDVVYERIKDCNTITWIRYANGYSEDRGEVVIDPDDITYLDREYLAHIMSDPDLQLGFE